MILVVGMLLTHQLQGSHIVGAELTYTCTGNSLYNVRLTLYRDCNSSTQFDNPIELYVFNRANNGVYTTITIPAPSAVSVVPENWDACVATPYQLCIERATYVTNINLPPNNSGYYFAWSRCCRNSTITNLADPQCEGVTFLAAVPPVSAAACNSMPVFSNTPSVFLCAGQVYNFDYSATDADGDSLVYSISNPFTGTNINGIGTGNNQIPACGSTLNPAVSPANPMGPPPYQNVVFAPGHSFTNPFGPGSSTSINPQTGYLSALPQNPGVYVMAISVREFRNGVFLSENKRDFQFHVIPCNLQGPPPVLTTNTGSLPVNGDTILVEGNRPFCFNFNVTDPLAPSVIQVTPISTIFGGNGGFPPPYATVTVNGTTPPVTGEICWTPACDYVGSVIPVIISARDTNDCPNYNIVFDTIWIRIIPPPEAPPLVQQDISLLPTNGDTILLGVNENFCYNFQVIDTLGGGLLDAEVRTFDINGNLLPQSQVVNTSVNGNVLSGSICWETGCNYGQSFMIVVTGEDEYQCPPNNRTRDTVFLRVLTPENPGPVMQLNTLGNILNGDTILAEVLSEFCYSFSVSDTSGISVDLDFAAILQTSSGTPAPGNAPVTTILSNSPNLTGSVCWTPSCENVDLVYQFVAQGVQENECGILSPVLDTIWVRVTEPIKPVPLISHDLNQGPTNNDLLTVQDADTFCFQFRLEDTLRPTSLRYEVAVLDQNGQLFLASPAPTVTYSVRIDSLLEGNVCWTVPCELSDQLFSLVMTGRDTFDCRLSSQVHDTVLIQHQELIPGVPNLCNVSVAIGDQSIDLDLESPSNGDLSGIVLYRSTTFDQGNLTAIDTILGTGLTTMQDETGVFADDFSYCYQMASIDRCGTISPLSNSLCTILLDGNVEGYVGELRWESQIGWPLGVAFQEIHRNFPEIPGNPNTIIASLDAVIRDYADNNIEQPRDCYRIRAVSNEGGCSNESWSNEICLDFPPTLFVPTAFTPNGDGLNDNFTNFGKFEATFLLQIWNRWGTLVFETTNPDPGWLGDYKGKPAPEGVYVYRMLVTGYDGKVLERNGSITLIR